MTGAPQRTGLSFSDMLRWSIAVIGAAPWVFALDLTIAVLLTLLVQVNFQLLSAIISAIGSTHGTAAAVGRADTSAYGRTAAFAAVSIVVVLLRIAGRLLDTWTDALLLGGLQQRLHDALLIRGMSGRTRPDVQSANSIVLQAAGLAMPVLRDVLAIPITRTFAFLSAVAFLLYNLATFGTAPLVLDVALVALLVLLPVVTWSFQGRLRQAFGSFGRSQHQLTVELGNSAIAPAEIVALGAQPQRSRAFATRLRGAMLAKLRAGLRLELARQIQLGMPVLVQAGFLVYGATLALKGRDVPIGGILALYYFAPVVMMPLQQILDAWLQLGASAGPVGLVGEILDTRPPAPTAPLALERPPRVTLSDVSISFDNRAAPVLAGLKHEFPAGSCTAVVGRAGSGKTTLLGLIGGLSVPDQGAVRIDGIQMTDGPLPAFSPAVGIVSDTPLLIADTVRENIRLAKANAEDDEIEAACRETGLWPLLLDMAPDRPLDHLLGRDPAQAMTGGARRLLAITRVLLRKPRLLLLDEPTTGLDAVDVDRLSVVLRRMAGATTIVLADHNLEFVAGLADTVCCLEDGRFFDVGAPADLASRPSLFARMLHSRRAMLATDWMSIRSVPLPTLEIAGETSRDAEAAGYSASRSGIHA